MSERKLQRYSVFIRQTLLNPATFSVPIHVPFTPTEVKVRQTSLFLTGTTAGTWNIQCDTLASQGNSNFGSLIDGHVSFPGIAYDIRSPVNDTYTFHIIDGAGGQAITLNNAFLAIHLEFRRPAPT